MRCQQGDIRGVLHWVVAAAAVAPARERPRDYIWKRKEDKRRTGREEGESKRRDDDAIFFTHTRFQDTPHSHLAKARPVSAAEADRRARRRPLVKVIVVLMSRQSKGSEISCCCCCCSSPQPGNGSAAAPKRRNILRIWLA